MVFVSFLSFPCPVMSDNAFANAQERVSASARARYESLRELPTVAPQERLDQALLALPSTLPEHGLGLETTISLLVDQLVPAVPAHSSRYFGFVTGGAFPAAQLADNIVSSIDVNLTVRYRS